MKIIYSIEDSVTPQDSYTEVKNDILSFPFSIDDPEVFCSQLELRFSQFILEDSYLNLRLWIPVLNKIDEILNKLLVALNSSEIISAVSDKIINSVIAVLQWYIDILRHSYNKSVFNSVEHIVGILKLTTNNNLVDYALQVLVALAIPPPNHRNVFVYTHSTMLHKNIEYTLPLFDVLLAANNISDFNVKHLVDNNSPITPFGETDHMVVSESVSVPVPRSKWWYDRFLTCCSSERTDNQQSWFWYKCYLRAIIVLVRTHRDLVDVGHFFGHKLQIQHDLLYILRENTLSDSDLKTRIIPSDVKLLAVQCVTALLDRSEKHFTEAQKEGEWSGAVRLIPPFDGLLQGQLGIDGAQIQGLVPSYLKQELQWVVTLNTTLDSSSSSVDNSFSKYTQAITTRLQHLESFLLLVLASLPIPKSIQTFLNNGIIDSILSVLRLHNLTDLRALVNSHHHHSADAKNDCVRVFHWEMYCIASLLVQILDMIISSKRGAMEAFYFANGPVLVMERLSHEAKLADKAAIAAFVIAQGDNHYLQYENSPLPVVYQSLVLSLTAVLDTLLNNHNNRDVRSGSHASLNQMELIRSSLFGEAIVSLCDGIASVSGAILASMVRMLCELINNDMAIPAVINLFLLQSPYHIVKKTYEAVSSKHIRHDIETMNSTISLVSALCIKEEGVRLITAVNPFQVVLGIFHDPHYLLTECLLLHASFAVQIGTACGDLLRTYPALSALFAKTLCAEMELVTNIATKFAKDEDSFNESKTLGSTNYIRSDNKYSDMIIGNMMIAILLCFDNVVERSPAFAREFIGMDGLKILHAFVTNMFGSRRFLLTSMSTKLGVTGDDHPGNNQLRRTLIHAFSKLMMHQTEAVMNGLSTRIAEETEQLTVNLAAYHSKYPREEFTSSLAAGADVDSDMEVSEDIVSESQYIPKLSKKHARSSSGSVTGGERKKGKIAKLRAIATKAKANKATSNTLATAMMSNVSKRNVTDLHLRNILDSLSDSTVDLFAFNYSQNDELFAVLYSMLRVEAAIDLFAHACQFAITMPEFAVHKYLTVIIPAVGNAALVNVNCVSEIGRAHCAVVSNNLDRDDGTEMIPQQRIDMDVNFDIYLVPGKNKMKVRDSIAETKGGKTVNNIECNTFLRASERICSEKSKSLTYFRLEDDAGYIRRREVDQVPNLEIVGIHAKTAGDQVSTAAFRRDQSISLYRVGKNVLRSVCNAFNDFIGVVPLCFRNETDSSQFKQYMEQLRGPLFDTTFVKILKWGYVNSNSIGGVSSGNNVDNALAFDVQKYLQFKYVFDTFAQFFSTKGSMHEQQNNSSSQLTGNSLAFASVYQYDDGSLFELLIKSCCLTINGCFPAADTEDKDPRLNVQERVFCLSIASKILQFLCNILHCLGASDSTWSKELHKTHRYLKPNMMKYNCFIRLYDHFKLIWSHPQLCSLPSHMCLKVTELMANFQECGLKIYQSSATHSDEETLAVQLTYLQSLGEAVEADSCRLFLHLAQHGGMHFEEKTTSFHGKDVFISPKLWPLNVLAEEADMKREEFLRQLTEIHLKGQVMMITITHKPYRCSSTLDRDSKTVDRGICAAIEKQYKVIAVILSQLFCDLAIKLQNVESNSDSIDYCVLEGLLITANNLVYVSGQLWSNICPPFQNAMTLLFTLIPEFAAVFSSLSALMTRAVSSVSVSLSSDISPFEQADAKWVFPALLFIDAAIQPFLINERILGYCELFSENIALAVKQYHAAFIQQSANADLFCNAIDENVIKALLMSTPEQHYYVGDVKKCCTLDELMKTAADPSVVNCSFVTPMAQLRAALGVDMVQNCIRIVSSLSIHQSVSTKLAPVLTQISLQVLVHLARDTIAAQEILKSNNLRAILETGIGFERLAQYLSSILQTAIEQTHNADLLRIRMQRTLLGAAEVMLEQELLSGVSEQKRKLKLAKNVGKFISIVESLMLRDPGLFLSVITDPSTFRNLHSPAVYIPFPSATPDGWQTVLSQTSEAMMTRVTQLYESIARQRLSDDIAVQSECNNLRCLLGELLVSIADMLHSVLPEQAHYFLNHCVTVDKKTDLFALLVDTILPAHAVSSDAASATTSLTWTSKRRLDMKNIGDVASVARNKLYSSGIYLMLSYATLEGAPRRHILSELSSRLNKASHSFSEDMSVRPTETSRLILPVLDFINALDVPKMSIHLVGVTFVVNADSILAALTALNVHTYLETLQNGVTSIGVHSPLSSNLSTATNLLQLRGLSAAREVSRFVQTCQEYLNAKNESSGSNEQPFWTNDLYLFTNVFAVARRANTQVDKLVNKNKHLSGTAGASQAISISTAQLRDRDVRGFFDGISGLFDDAEEGDESDHDDAIITMDNDASHHGSSHSFSAAGGNPDDEEGDDIGDESLLGEGEDDYSDLDDDDDGDGGHGYSDEENDFIDDDGDDDEDEHVIHLNGGAGNLWQQVGGQLGGHFQHQFQAWAGAGEDGRGDGSDMSIGSDDSEADPLHDLGDEDFDDFDMMSAPPDSDDDDDSEMNDADGSAHGDDNTVDESIIFVDESVAGADTAIEGGEDEHARLSSQIRIDNNIYHMLGFLFYNESLELKSIFADMLGPLLGEKKEVHFGRPDFRHLNQAANTGRIALSYPAVSRRNWGTDLDFVTAVINSVVLMPYFTYLMLQDEFKAELAVQDATWKDLPSLVALESVYKSMGAGEDEKPSIDHATFYSYETMIRKIRAATGAAIYADRINSISVYTTEISKEHVSLSALSNTIAETFVDKLIKYSERNIVANFNRQLNLKCMSLFKLCLATNTAVRTSQLSLSFLYTSQDRTREWDMELMRQLVKVLHCVDEAKEMQDEANKMSRDDRLILFFEAISYQFDEMYRHAEHVMLGIRHALLTPPPTLLVKNDNVSMATSNDNAVDSSMESLIGVSSSPVKVNPLDTGRLLESTDSEKQSGDSPAESVLGLLLNTLHTAVSRGATSSTIKEVLHIINHLLTLCEKESSTVSLKLNETYALHLFVPVIQRDTMATLCGFFLRDDLFVGSERYQQHFSRLMNFLCQKKVNWLTLIACSEIVGKALIRTVETDTVHILNTTMEQLASKPVSHQFHMESPVKAAKSSSSSSSASESKIEEHSSMIDSSEGNNVDNESSTVLTVKPPRQTVQFFQPNAELRLVHFFDLLQSTTHAMNHCGVNMRKDGTAVVGETTEPASHLNGTMEDMNLLGNALKMLQDSVVWLKLIEIMKHLNNLVNTDSSAAAVEPVKVSKLSAYGSIAAEHQRMLPLIECLFQVATLPTVLFNHITSQMSADRQHHGSFDSTKSSSKTPMILRDVSLSTGKLKGPRDATAKQTIRLFDSYVTSKLFTLVEENKKLLNTKLNQNIRLLELSLQAMRTVPELSKFLDFSVKRKYLRLQIKRLKRPMKWRDMTEEQRVVENVDESDDEQEGGGVEDEEADNVSVCVDRDDVLNQSFHCIQNYTPRQLMRGTFRVTFNNEDGMDAGGLTREWLLILTRCIFKPAYALFSLSGDGVTYQPNPHSGANPEHLDYFKFIGRLVAKAICDNQLLDVHFTRSFYKHILRVPISFSDLEAFDKEYYKSLNALLQHSLEDLGLDLTFTATANVFGTEVRSDLVEDGENVAVTDDNKAEYVRLIAHHCLTTSFQKQIDAFLDGFHELLPHSLFSHFDPSELELLISGLPEVDIEDLFAHTTYTGYKLSDPVIQRFWTVLRSFSNEEKALFVQFVTGTSKVPLDGFQSLQGSEGIQMFSIHKAYKVELLPTAHTCFNQLDLPEYPTEEIMRDKLVLAIRECSEGFGFQ